MIGSRALIVEDDPAVRGALADMLASFGISISAVGDVREALELLKREPVNFILLDLQLRGESGMVLAEQAIQLQPEACTLIITGHPSFQSSVQAMRLGVCDYLSKPLSLEALRQAMQRAWTQRGSQNGRRSPDTTAAVPAKEPRVPEPFIVSSPEMRAIRAQTRRLAELDKPMFISGEKGVGKSLLARLIHQQSSRCDSPLVHFRCDGLRDGQPVADISSERQISLASAHGFARELFDQAAGGTLLLGDVDRLPMWGQVRLLEVLDGYGVDRPKLSANRPRLITTSSGDLKGLTDAGKFAAPLYFRLSVAQLRVPPLRQRPDDIRAIGSFVLYEQQRRSQRPTPRTIDEGAWQRLLKHSWPGNVSELINVIERAAIECVGETIESAAIERVLPAEPASVQDVETVTIPVMPDIKEMERRIVREVIYRCAGNKAAAARRLGMHRKTIYRLLNGDSSKADMRPPFAPFTTP